MTVLTPQSEFGHAPPPQTDYSIVSNLPGWDMLRNFRDGDMSPMARVVHIYPRFTPKFAIQELNMAVAKKLGLEDKACLLYLDPIMWPYTARHVQNEHRKQYAITPDRLTHKVVDIGHEGNRHRLFALLYAPQDGMALRFSWGTPGIGISVREAEHLLAKADTITEVPFADASVPPLPTYTPEGNHHKLLRQRIVDLVRHGAIDPQQIQCQPKDVFLYPSGMAAIFRSKNTVEDYLPDGVNVELGVLFHNTHELLCEESKKGWKHFGRVDKAALDEFATWLDGNKAAYVLVETPGNPTCQFPDLKRLKQLSEKHGFVLVVDDTISSFGNVDVFAYSDILLTSLTKSFSGRSNVMGGSIVLNPLSPHYGELSKRFTETYRNELFAADAEVLLSNSQDYYERTAKLNGNAQAMAELLHKSITEVPGSPVTRVQYPSLLPSKQYYDAFKKKGTPELPEPGYGCLMTVEFDSIDATRAFYDNCGFYSSPHLGAHVTIMLAYNMLMFGEFPDTRAEYREYDAKEESVRLSAGLEDRQDLLDTVQHALQEAIKVKGSRATE